MTDSRVVDFPVIGVSEGLAFFHNVDSVPVLTLRLNQLDHAVVGRSCERSEFQLELIRRGRNQWSVFRKSLHAHCRTLAGTKCLAPLLPTQISDQSGIETRCRDQSGVRQRNFNTNDRMTLATHLFIPLFIGKLIENPFET